MAIKTDRLRDTWTQLGHEDPLWAILSHQEKRGGRWDVDDFMATGAVEIERALKEASEVATIQTGRALDFGCGVGRLSQALASHFERVDGVDIAESMVAQAREFNSCADRCSYHVNTEPDLRLFQDSEFDFVYSNITLQHMPPELALGYISEFVRVLRPGGSAVFQVAGEPHAPDSLWQRVLRWGFVQVQSLRRRPVMDMFGVSESDVRKAASNWGGIIVQIDDENDAAGPHWTSSRYFLRRDSATP